MDEGGLESKDFSLASNVIDFGMRAYLIDRKSTGTGSLIQIFPKISPESSGSSDYKLWCTSSEDYQEEIDPSIDPLFCSFPDVVDIMIRVLTSEGARVISAFEEGILPLPSDVSDEGEFWWKLADENSEVFIRRIRIQAKGL